MNITQHLAPPYVRWADENGCVTRQYRSYASTVSVVMDVIPVNVATSPLSNHLTASLHSTTDKCI
mgnify:FL=1